MVGIGTLAPRLHAIIATARASPASGGQQGRAQWGAVQAPQDLFEATAQALLAGVDRDALAGWGAVVYLVTPAGVTARTLKGRMD